MKFTEGGKEKQPAMAGTEGKALYHGSNGFSHVRRETQKSNHAS